MCALKTTNCAVKAIQNRLREGQSIVLILDLSMTQGHLTKTKFEEGAIVRPLEFALWRADSTSLIPERISSLMTDQLHLIA